MPAKPRKSTNFLVTEESDLSNALNRLKTHSVTGGTDTKTFEWNQRNVWRNRGSRHIVMIVDAAANKMELQVHSTGQWKLTGKVALYVRQHEWVFKLDAHDSSGALLFTLVTPRIMARPADDKFGNEADVAVSGFSPNVLTHFANIDHWIRRGSGDYWD